MGSDREAGNSGNWNCPGCDERLEGTFHACWNCGTTREGGAPLNHDDDTAMADSERDEQSRRFWLWAWIVSWGSIIPAIIFAYFSGPIDQASGAVAFILLFTAIFASAIFPIVFLFSLLPSGNRK